MCAGTVYVRSTPSANKVVKALIIHNDVINSPQINFSVSSAGLTGSSEFCEQ
jgi:hypothetical protein